mmetsp:Transcript_3990/g.16645  ORF Transcript_3990/g.16645 Transcript_3990/m.16645 type:complete len:236 (-) Transcript_3990:605-1312(-)
MTPCCSSSGPAPGPAAQSRSRRAAPLWSGTGCPRCSASQHRAGSRGASSAGQGRPRACRECTPPTPRPNPARPPEPTPGPLSSPATAGRAVLPRPCRPSRRPGWARGRGICRTTAPRARRTALRDALQACGAAGGIRNRCSTAEQAPRPIPCTAPTGPARLALPTRERARRSEAWGAVGQGRRRVRQAKAAAARAAGPLCWPRTHAAAAPAHASSSCVGRSHQPPSSHAERATRS